MRRLNVALALVAGLSILAASGAASAATVTRSADFSIPSQATGYAVVEISSSVPCELTAEFTFGGVTTVRQTEGAETDLTFRFDYRTGDTAETLHVTATCVFDDVYADPGLFIRDPFLSDTGGNADPGLLPSTGGARLLLLVAGLAAVVAGGYGAHRWRRT